MSTTTDTLPPVEQVLGIIPRLDVMRLDDSRVRRSVYHVTGPDGAGYTMTYEGYGHGTPGYMQQIGRDSDTLRLYAGPHVDVPYRAPEWDALPAETRRAVRAALRMAAPCMGCDICERYRAVWRILQDREHAARLADAERRLRRSLVELAELDARLPHTPDADWSPEDRRRRATLVWEVTRHALTLDWPVAVEWTGGQGPYDCIVYVELPVGQVSWHTSREHPGIPGAIWTALDRARRAPVGALIPATNRMKPTRVIVAYDGHTREGKAQRIAAWLAATAS